MLILDRQTRPAGRSRLTAGLARNEEEVLEAQRLRYKVIAEEMGANPLPLHALNQYLDAPIPQLIKGYLRPGAYICGEPAWDAEFNTADLLILLPMSRMSDRYAKHFLEMQPGKPCLNG